MPARDRAVMPQDLGCNLRINPQAADVRILSPCFTSWMVVTVSAETQASARDNRRYCSLSDVSCRGWMTLVEDPCTDSPVNARIPDPRLADALASGKDDQQK
jgi:hypothetical protein